MQVLSPIGTHLMHMHEGSVQTLVSKTEVVFSDTVNDTKLPPTDFFFFKY